MAAMSAIRMLDPVAISEFRSRAVILTIAGAPEPHRWTASSYIRSVPKYKQCTPFSISVTPQGDLRNRSFPLQIRLLLPRENSRTMHM
jgi:hypothetical protein